MSNDVPTYPWTRITVTGPSVQAQLRQPKLPQDLQTITCVRYVLVYLAWHNWLSMTSGR